MAYMKDWRGQKIDGFDPMRDLRDLVALYRFTDLDPTMFPPGTVVKQVTCKANRGGDLLPDSANAASVVVGSGTPSGAPTVRIASNAFLSNPNLGVAGSLAWGYPPIEGEFTIAALCKGDSAAGVSGSRLAVSGGLYGGARLYASGPDGRTALAGPGTGATGGSPACDDNWHMLVARFTQGWTDVWKDGYFANGAIAGGAPVALLAAAAAGATTINTDVTYASGTALLIGVPGTENYERVVTSGTPTGTAGNYTVTLAAGLLYQHAQGTRVKPPTAAMNSVNQLRGIGVGGRPGSITGTWVGEFAEVMVLRRLMYPDEILAYTRARFTANGVSTSPLPSAQGQLPYREAVTDANTQPVSIWDPNRSAA